MFAIIAYFWKQFKVRKEEAKGREMSGGNCSLSSSIRPKGACARLRGGKCASFFMRTLTRSGKCASSVTCCCFLCKNASFHGARRVLKGCVIITSTSAELMRGLHVLFCVFAFPSDQRGNKVDPSG